ncbi:MAG: nicotinate-nucleotide adenylyltransferase [Nitrospirota bacterium]
MSEVSGENRDLQHIGLFGGTFNPIHTGHIRIANEIREHFSLDSIIFIPAGAPPHKDRKEVIEPVHRLRMVELAIAKYKYFSVSSIEVFRDGFSYSIDTVSALQNELGDSSELYFITGLDAFLEIRTWKDADKLLTLCSFVVIQRPGHRFAELKGIDLPAMHNVSASDLESLDRGELQRLSIPMTERYSLFLERITPCVISSTELRRLIRAGKEVKNLLPENVMSYIIENGLYHEKNNL